MLQMMKYFLHLPSNQFDCSVLTKKNGVIFLSWSSIILLNQASDQLHSLSTYNWVLIDRIDQQVIEVLRNFVSVVMDFDF